MNQDVLERDLLVSVEHHGAAHGMWAILTESLDQDSRVISVGIGEDVSFDLSLIHKYGCVVHGYDPTPRSVRWVHNNIHDPRFVFHQQALWDTDGTMCLFLPKIDTVISASCATGPFWDESPYQVPSSTLSTIMANLGFATVDLLKIDIEGAEFRVIENALADGSLFRVGQFLVEFHGSFPAFGEESTREAIVALRAAGWKVGWISETRQEVLLISPSRLSCAAIARRIGHRIDQLHAK